MVCSSGIGCVFTRGTSRPQWITLPQDLGRVFSAAPLARQLCWTRDASRFPRCLAERKCRRASALTLTSVHLDPCWASVSTKLVLEFLYTCLCFILSCLHPVSAGLCVMIICSIMMLGSPTVCDVGGIFFFTLFIITILDKFGNLACLVTTVFPRLKYRSSAVYCCTRDSL